ncbi:MAG: hypothetical protein J0649_05490 [Methylococcales bacterium]|jgi:hypothetical protein|nr:hypothetical protein [Methylococcales bacterium]
MQSFSYNTELFDRVIDSTSGNEIEILEKILRWRGFLVKKDTSGVLVSRGINFEDFQALVENRLPLSPVFSREWGAKIHPNVSIDQLRNLFLLPSMNGMVGKDYYNDTYATFKKCRYGAKVPVNHLDYGIAMLVKVMPLLGLFTVMSCDGHLSSPPMIWFKNIHHVNFAKRILVQCQWDGNLPYEDEGWSWLRFQWQVMEQSLEEIGDTVENRFNYFNNIQQLCNYIMDSDISTKARLLK